MWINPQLERAIRERATVADLHKLKDAMSVAFKQSLDKHWPTIVNIS